MTNKELITWARVASEDEDDFLKRLIWIAKLQERTRVFKELAGYCRMESDVSSMTSYPSKRMLKELE